MIITGSSIRASSFEKSAVSEPVPFSILGITIADVKGKRSEEEERRKHAGAVGNHDNALMCRMRCKQESSQQSGGVIAGDPPQNHECKQRVRGVQQHVGQMKPERPRTPQRVLEGE
jgi:hypothetical protein